MDKPIKLYKNLQSTRNLAKLDTYNARINDMSR